MGRSIWIVLLAFCGFLVAGPILVARRHRAVPHDPVRWVSVADVTTIRTLPCFVQWDGAVALGNQSPRPTSFSRPAYPAELAERGVRGLVALVLLVDENGHVTGICESAGPIELRRLVEEVAPRWKFPPLPFGPGVRTEVLVHLDFVRLAPSPQPLPGNPNAQ